MSDQAADHFFTRHRQSVKDAMLSLVYPAVLGSVFFVVFQMLATPIAFALGRMMNSSVAADAVSSTFQPLKIGLLAATVLFYHCDYFYIKYTNSFSIVFCLADVVFLFVLSITLIAINPLSPEPPATTLIASCYLLFFVIYFGWDWYEREHTSNDHEKRYYLRVFAWEIASAAALGAHLVGWPSCLGGSGALLAIIALAAILFVPIVWWKKRYYCDAPGIAAPAK